MERKIIKFFKERNVRPYFIREFMRFLMEHDVYNIFIFELTQLLNDVIINNGEDVYTIEDWKSWTSCNLCGSEDRIIDKFFIWSATSNEQLWCDLNAIWSDHFLNIEKNTYGTCYKSHSK